MHTQTRRHTDTERRATSEVRRAGSAAGTQSCTSVPMDTDTVSAAGHSLLPIGAAHRGVIRRTHGRGPSAAADHHGCFGNTCGSTQVFLDPKISFYKTSRGPSAPGHSSATSGHQHTTTMRGGKEGYFASPSWESSVASGDDSGMTTVQSSPVALHPSPVALHQRATDLASILEVCTRYLDFIPINLPEICVRVVLDLLHLAIFVLLGACVC